MAENRREINDSKTTREIRLTKRARKESIKPYLAPHIKKIVDVVVDMTNAKYPVDEESNPIHHLPA